MPVSISSMKRVSTIHASKFAWDRCRDDLSAIRWCRRERISTAPTLTLLMRTRSCVMARRMAFQEGQRLHRATNRAGVNPIAEFRRRPRAQWRQHLRHQQHQSQSLILTPSHRRRRGCLPSLLKENVRSQSPRLPLRCKPRGANLHPQLLCLNQRRRASRRPRYRSLELGDSATSARITESEAG